MNKVWNWCFATGQLTLLSYIICKLQSKLETFHVQFMSYKPFHLGSRSIDEEARQDWNWPQKSTSTFSWVAYEFPN